MITIESIAYALPKYQLSNEELRRTFPKWDLDRLEIRTGVLSRPIVSDGETALDFAVDACEQLRVTGRLDVDSVDGVIFCTQSPDYIMPPNSCLLHARLGMKTEVLAFDITLACSGYIYGLQLASSLIRSGAASRILLATADTYSRYINPEDRATRCLFGDGGAVSVIATASDGHGLRDIMCGTSGKDFDKFLIEAGGMRTPRSSRTALTAEDSSGNVRCAENIRMDGFGVMSFFNATLPAWIRRLLSRNGLSIEDVDVFVFHQASKLVLDNLRVALRIPASKMVYDLEETGNLVSASIPIALSRALDSGRAKAGQLALLCGFGVGLSWGAALIEL